MLKIEPEFHPNDIIKIFVGDNSSDNFLLHMAEREPKPPAFKAPVGRSIADCDLSVGLCKNVIIVGHITTDLINLLLDAGAWSVVGLCENDELKLANADVFRSTGFEWRNKRRTT